MKQLFLSGLLSISLFVSAQNKSKTSPQQDIEKELQELEKDDPEMAKKVRAMMKQQPQKKVPVKSAAIIHPSQVTAINLKVMPAIPTALQARDRLLWYKGKKANDSTLITTTGTLVQYKKKRHLVIVQPAPARNIFKHLDRQLSRNSSIDTEFMKEESTRKNSFFLYPGYMNGIKESDTIVKKYRDLSNNTLDLETFDANDEPIGIDEQSGIKGIPVEAVKKYQEVLHMIQNPPAIEIPQPPAKDFDMCFDCNLEASKKFWNDQSDFHKEIGKFENQLYGKAVTVTKLISDLSLDTIEPMVEKMRASMDFAFTRLIKKIALLEKEYGDDPHYALIIIQENLALIRQTSLTQIAANDSADVVVKVLGYIDKIINHVKEEMYKKNYSTGFNVGLIFTLYKEKYLISGKENDMVQMREHFNELMRYNRFKLSMSMEAEAASKTVIASAKIETPPVVYVSLGMSGCKFTLFLTETNYRKAEEKEYYLPFLFKSGQKQEEEEDDKWVTYRYSGPVNLNAVFPTVKIDFCEKETDSFYVSIVLYLGGDIQSYAQKLPKAYTIDLLGIVNLLVLNLEDTESSVPEEEEAAVEMMAIAASSGVAEPSGIGYLDEMGEDYYKFFQMQRLQQKIGSLAASKKVFLQFDAHNGKEELIDESYSSGPGNGDLRITNGKIKINVTQDPVRQ